MGRAEHLRVRRFLGGGGSLGVAAIPNGGRRARVTLAWSSAVALSAVAACGLLLTGCGGDAGSAVASAGRRHVHRDGVRRPRPCRQGRRRPGALREVHRDRLAHRRLWRVATRTPATPMAFAEASSSKVTRTCVYDRANLGQSDPRRRTARSRRSCVGDLEQICSRRRRSPARMCWSGTSGGGYIAAGYAFAASATQVAGMVFVDTGPPFRNPPARDRRGDGSARARERRAAVTILQVEKDAWAATQARSATSR